MLASLTLAGCGGATDDGGPYAAAVDGAQAGPSEPAAPVATPAGDPAALGSTDPPLAPAVELCERIDVVRSRLTALSDLELRPTARVTLDIELSRVQAGFSDMRQAASDAREGLRPVLDPCAARGARAGGSRQPFYGRTMPAGLAFAPLDAPSASLWTRSTRLH